MRCRLHQRFGIIRLAKVRLKKMRRAAVGTDQVDHGLGFALAMAIVDADRRAQGRKALGRGRADARAGAGDQNAFAL